LSEADNFPSFVPSWCYFTFYLGNIPKVKNVNNSLQQWWWCVAVSVYHVCFRICVCRAQKNVFLV